jgi:hypothetical protein
MSIRNTIFQFILRRQPKRQVVLRTWESVHTVAVLYDCGDKETIMKQLTAQNKHIDFFGVPNKQDVCWLSQRPSKQLLEQLRDYHYELLIDLTQQPTLTTQYMAMYIRADFKAGGDRCEGILDLTISTPPQETPYYLLEQILRYIQMFTQKQK